MKTTVVETSPIVNFKTGSKKLIDNGLMSIIKLLILAAVFYALYQLLVLASVGDSYKDLVDALQVFESDTTQTTQLKDAFVEFIRSSGPTLVLSWLLIGVLSLAYSVATMRVYINSIREKDTSLKEAIQVGIERIGVSLFFAVYVTAIVTGYIILITMLSALVPFLLLVFVPLSFLLLAMLVVRVLYSGQILADSEKPNVLSIFESSKNLVKKSGTALFLYILLGIAISILTGVLFDLFTRSFGVEPSSSLGLLTADTNDLVYNSTNFIVFGIVGFFLNAGWVEIYSQAKQATESSPKSSKIVQSKPKKKAKKA